MNQNETDRLENQLKSWKPLRPSAGLQESLFGSMDTLNVSVSPGNSKDAVKAWLQPLARWLVPAAVCCLATLLSVTWRSPDVLGESGRQNGSMLALAAFTNQSLAAYLPSTGTVERNGLPSGIKLAQK